jgi:hypothetical protein
MLRGKDQIQQHRRARLAQALKPLLNKLGERLLDIEDPELRRDVEMALQAIEKVYARMTGKRWQGS